MAFSGFKPTAPVRDASRTGPNDSELDAAFALATAALEAISTRVADFDSVADETLVRLLESAAAIHRLGGSLLAIVSGQLERRSAPEFGSKGLARQKGHRTPVQMVKVVGQLPGVDVARALRAGRLIHETQIGETAEIDGGPPTDPITGDVLEPLQPWLAPVGHALTRGLSPAAADAIQRGLGTPTEGVPAAVLLAAAEKLCVEAESLDPDLLFDRASRMRDELDVEGIGLREEERRQMRSLTLVRQRDGMSRMVWLMDPETAAIATEIYDRTTSPRRGGPRHGRGTAVQAHADRILADSRTTEQFASDTFVQLLQHGVATDPSLVLGTGIPSVRILTTARVPAPRLPGAASSGPGAGAASTVPGTNPPLAGDVSHIPVASDFGPGWIEGQRDPVSPETVARLICTGATVEIPFDETGQPLDVGREQRLFGRKQRVGLGARDGGCRAGDLSGNGLCDRPPSWTEAHHVEQWNRDGGATDIANGILICKFHHLILHNEGWEIHRDGATYWLIPPVTVDPTQTPREMVSRSSAMEQLARLSRDDPTSAPADTSTGDAPDDPPDSRR